MRRILAFFGLALASDLYHMEILASTYFQIAKDFKMLLDITPLRESATSDTPKQ